MIKRRRRVIDKERRGEQRRRVAARKKAVTAGRRVLHRCLNVYRANRTLSCTSKFDQESGIVTPIFINKLLPDSVAAQSKRVRVGDVLLGVNGGTCASVALVVVLLL